MATCKKCGGEIAFKRLDSGKMCPTNVDGSDHWDTCSELRFKNDAAYRRRIQRRQSEVRITNPLGRTKFYSGDIPPWDESLGEFQEI